MKRIIFLALAILMLAVPAHAITVNISDQGGGHVGYCIDGQLAQGRGTFTAYSNYNYGVRTTGNCGRYNDITDGLDQVMLFRFDLSDIPNGATIDSASLNLEVTGFTSAGTVTVDVYEIVDANNDWVEGTKDGVAEVNSPCHNYYGYDAVTPTHWDNGAVWETTGNWTDTSFDSNVVAGVGSESFVFNAAGKQAIADRLVADDIELVVVADDYTGNASDYVQFGSSENATAADRPYLTVAYTEAEGAAQVIIIRR